MTDSELSPIKRADVSGYVMASADLDTVPTAYLPKMQQAGGLREVRSTTQAIGRSAMALSTILQYSGMQADDARKVQAAMMLVSGGVQALGALRTVYDMLSAAKLAEGAAHLSKWAWAAPAVAGVAIAAAVAYESTINEHTRDYSFSGDYSTASGVRQMQRQVAGVM